MAVNRPVIDEHIVVISRVHQLVASFDHTGAHGQRFKDHEFGDGERYRHVIPRNRVAGGVHNQTAPPNGIGQGFAAGLLFFRLAPHDIASAQDRFNPRNKQTLAERLGDVIISPHRQAKRLIGLVILAGQENQRQVTFFAQAAQEFDAIHARHFDIAHRKIGRVIQHGLQRSVAVAVKTRDEALGLQSDRNRGQDIAIIIDKRNGSWVSRRFAALRWITAHQ